MIETGEAVDQLKFCAKVLPCGHSCKGVEKERKCLPCLDAKCTETSGLVAGTTEEELCHICYTSELGTEPCSKLGCGHVYHTRCVIEQLSHKWPSLRITFAFMSCPLCKTDLDIAKLSQPIQATLGPLNGLKNVV